MVELFLPCIEAVFFSLLIRPRASLTDEHGQRIFCWRLLLRLRKNWNRCHVSLYSLCVGWHYFAMNGEKSIASNFDSCHTLLSQYRGYTCHYRWIFRFYVAISFYYQTDWCLIECPFSLPFISRFYFFSFAFILSGQCSSLILHFPMEFKNSRWNPMWWATFVPFHLNAELSISKAGEQTTSVSVRWLPNNQHWLNENGSRLCSYYVLFILIVMSIVFYCGHCSEIVLVHRRCSFFIVAHLLFCPTFCIREYISNSYDLSSGLHLIIFFSCTVVA